MTQIHEALQPDPRVPTRPKQDHRNWWAIISFVVGLLGFLPYIPGAIAVLTGILGVRKGANPLVGGRRMAVVGVLLGVTSLVFWTVGRNAWTLMKESEAPRAVARSFVRDLSIGDREAARAKMLSATPLAVESWIRDAEVWGRFESFTTSSVSMTVRDGVPTCELSGIAEFEETMRTIDMTLVETPNGWRVSEFRVVIE